ncbi:MAG: hypothetical protein ABI651_21210 [Verrucomicrobiota bacterium]
MGAFTVNRTAAFDLLAAEYAREHSKLKDDLAWIIGRLADLLRAEQTGQKDFPPLPSPQKGIRESWREIPAPEAGAVVCQRSEAENGSMKQPWHKVRLGEVLRHRKEFVPPLQGGEVCGDGCLGLRAGRFTPGYHMTGLQPAARDIRVPGLKARQVIARIGASNASGGPGTRFHKLIPGLKGRNNSTDGGAR